MTDLKVLRRSTEEEEEEEEEDDEEGYHGRDRDSEVSSTTGGSVEKRKIEQVTSCEEIGTSEDAVKKPKVSFGFNKPTSTVGDNGLAKSKLIAPISIKLGAQKPKEAQPSLPKASATVAKVFSAADEDDDDEEEMPPEAKMRMRNLGRDTPTSSGPNSFGKTRRGFCDTRKSFDKDAAVPKSK